MIRVLVLTHGDLAISILNAAHTIDPQLAERTEAMALPWDVDSDSASGSLKQRLRELDTGGGVLILTDMFGGTATNLALPFLDRDRVEIVTGVNLPMLVKLGSLRDQELPLA
jgi:PTS system mannose-specific IIA component